MRPFKIFLILLIVLAIFITPAGCTRKPGSATEVLAEEPVKAADESPEQAESKQDQKEVDNYLKELRGWEDYIAEYWGEIIPIDRELMDLGSKRLEALAAGNKNEAVSYLEKEEQKSGEIIEALNLVNVPEIAKQYHDYKTKSFIEHKKWAAYIFKSIREQDTGVYDFDETTAQNFINERDLFNAQALQEDVRIIEYLNQKAEELDLPVPYPDKD